MSEPEATLNSSSLAFVEELYLNYLKAPDSVPQEWRAYFETLPANGLAGRAPLGLGPSFESRGLFGSSRVRGPVGASADVEVGSDAASLQHRTDMMVRNYRVRGHRVADLNPLGREDVVISELDPRYYGFRESDMEREVLVSSLPGARTLGEVIDGLKMTYARSIGVQFMHIDDLSIRQWLQERMERTRNRLELSRETQLRILTKLTDAIIFEEFIQKKYIGAKSFSLEGGESLIPLLDLAIEKAGSQDIREIVLGMAHRGRLNVLANIMGKNPRAIFREFEDIDPEMNRGRGDVKYHLGYSNDWLTVSGKKIHLSLSFNPSHLEFVNPVVLGRVRAKQDRFSDKSRERGMAILIHGDAAFIGEGVVQETLNLSKLEGYEVGGALHIIVNNQIGFTTGVRQGRSTPYASDIAKMLQSPIFHVNGEDPEAVTQVIELAMDFRESFKSDVVIDMYCYRRHGHNEGDEPFFTQPEMYQKIKQRPTVHDGYLRRLLALGEVSGGEAEQIAQARREQLEQELSVARSEEFKPHYSAFEGIWRHYRGDGKGGAEEGLTGIPEKRARKLLKRLSTVPEVFNVHPKIRRGLHARTEMAEGRRPLDWASAEALAFASLLTEGIRIRMTGQDSERGTFSHRHAVLHDVQDGHEYMPLEHLSSDQAPIEIHNSPLSEAGVLGFEYGYSLDMPDGLIIWEAQFGDFNNAAQVIIDQFIASAEDKWNRLSGLVMLLPHGFEGQGPEHSSARLERFLQLAAEENIQIANPTTTAQYFHLLRRQVQRSFRKPLVVMAPKSLLRHPGVVSELSAFTGGGFRHILPDDSDPNEVDRILMCSGKIYYELLQEKQQRGREDVAIIRLEQLYPLGDHLMEDVLAPYALDIPITWVQEEPENMGAWRYLRVKWGETLFGRPFSGVFRTPSASPATGSGSSHKIEQAELIREAFAEIEGEPVVIKEASR
jgi:2-oxoglutarate dehydrogenase E1 component